MRACVRACVRYGVSVIVKRPVLPPCGVDGRSRYPLYYYYHANCLNFSSHTPVAIFVLISDMSSTKKRKKREKKKKKREIQHLHHGQWWFRFVTWFLRANYNLSASGNVRPDTSQWQ